MPTNDSSDEYELVPEQEIEELKDELKRLKEFEVKPTKKLGVNLSELSVKTDRLLAIFEEAFKELKVEEGGLSFQEKMKPLLERMDKVLEQNSEIAQGMVALNDQVQEMKEKIEAGAAMPTSTEPEPTPKEVTIPAQGTINSAPPGPSPPPMPPQGAPAPPPRSLPGMAPPIQGGVPPPPPPAPPKKRGLFR